MSTSEAIASTSAPQISSAASSVQPPAKTARRANRSCSAGVSRSWLQAIVARSVRCRSGADREPPASRGSRCSSRSSSDRQRERLHASGRQLDRERQAVEAPADLGDLAVRREVGADGQRPAARRAPPLRARATGRRRPPTRRRRAAARGSSRAPSGADTSRSSRPRRQLRRADARSCRARAAAACRRPSPASVSFEPSA